MHLSYIMGRSQSKQIALLVMTRPVCLGTSTNGMSLQIPATRCERGFQHWRHLGFVGPFPAWCAAASELFWPILYNWVKSLVIP
ncbi:hypothetical protein CDAR_315111 [Caerostris darwini]|uniref:Uncharacterized protein n=1 Tax=Caerostris darwini TaxID=1538125 RepID=A0AAV4TQL3_9ARAC|nr:hypothetical protein CDAR_315111 [Caerostris darwini]